MGHWLPRIEMTPESANSSVDPARTGMRVRVLVIFPFKVVWLYEFRYK